MLIIPNRKGYDIVQLHQTRFSCMFARYYVQIALKRCRFIHKSKGHWAETIYSCMASKGCSVLVLFCLGICQYPQLLCSVESTVASLRCRKTHWSIEKCMFYELWLRWAFCSLRKCDMTVTPLYILNEEVFTHPLNEWWHVEIDALLSRTYLNGWWVFAYLYILRQGYPPAEIK